MPSDTDLAGRLKDHVALMMKTAQACIKNFGRLKHREDENFSGVNLALANTKTSLQNIQNNVSVIDKTSKVIIEGLISEMHIRFNELHLPLEQEEVFLN